ncbi:hypothetical protein KVF89_28055 [Nocardioides carbamazepini]|uniref:hypothetical protein n=1 Tax=Nocardioides carbamazepini TaxID=2854259 RepID=UPI00214A0425|nr:hypothetical protein [Nocardioides carbamazepini]MCR1786420.1 hypothetical protein [Nocardioides carbamazepini]
MTRPSMLDGVRSRAGHRAALAVATGLVVALALALSPLSLGRAGAASAGGAWKSTSVARSTLFSTNFWSYDVNAKGAGAAAWVDGDGDRRRVRVARRAPNGKWGRPHTLTGNFSWKGLRNYAGTNDVAIDDRGKVTVVWTQSKGKSVLVKTASSKGKRGWSKPRTLSPKGDRTGFPRIAVSGNGYAVVHWAGHFDTGVTDFTLYASYRAPGGTWEAAQRLDVDPAWHPDARASEPAIDDRGVATIAWDDIRVGAGPASSRVRLASRGPAAGWAQQTMAEGSLDQPSVATTRDGRLVAAWRDSTTIFARHRAADGRWGPTEQVVTGGLQLPQNATDVGIAETGRAVIYGEEVDTRNGTVLPYVAIQEAPGSPWTRENATAAFPAYGYSLFLPQLEVGAGGDVTLTWEQQYRSEKRWPLALVRHRAASGAWGEVRRLAGRASNPMVGSDARGRTSFVYGAGDRVACCVSIRAAKIR